mmetsp:Transcript_62251/g.131589  ORF Transcript_62251/g.131589 Transcript_62251/m.131589 type:complete len:291 (-) Transcript_62251:16-888(-)
MLFFQCSHCLGEPLLRLFIGQAFLHDTNRGGEQGWLGAVQVVDTSTIGDEPTKFHIVQQVLDQALRDVDQTRSQQALADPEAVPIVGFPKASSWKHHWVSARKLRTSVRGSLHARSCLSAEGGPEVVKSSCQLAELGIFHTTFLDTLGIGDAASWHENDELVSRRKEMLIDKGPEPIFVCLILVWQFVESRQDVLRIAAHRHVNKMLGIIEDPRSLYCIQQGAATIHGARSLDSPHGRGALLGLGSGLNRMRGRHQVDGNEQSFALVKGGGKWEKVPPTMDLRTCSFFTF